MTCAFHRHEFGFGRNEPQGVRHFVHASERIARSVHEQARNSQVGQMLNAELLGFTRRVQRVGKQEESGDKLWFGGAKYRCLASTIGMPTEKDPATDISSQGCNRIAKTHTISFRIPRKRRASSPLLAKGQIAT